VITIGSTRQLVRRRHLALKVGAVAFFVGLLLAIATSAGIVGERVTLGRVAVGVIASGAATLAALVVAGANARRALVTFLEVPRPGSHEHPREARLHPLVILVPQILGAVAGVLLVHLLLRRGVLGTFPWLSEKPAQLVNDAVAVSSLLALAWACADDLDPGVLIVAFVVVTLYTATAHVWHLDRAPGGFQTTVQQFVVAELVAAAIALGVYRTLGSRYASRARR